MRILFCYCTNEGKSREVSVWLKNGLGTVGIPMTGWIMRFEPESYSGEFEAASSKYAGNRRWSRKKNNKLSMQIIKNIHISCLDLRAGRMEFCDSKLFKNQNVFFSKPILHQIFGWLSFHFCPTIQMQHVSNINPLFPSVIVLVHWQGESSLWPPYYENSFFFIREPLSRSWAHFIWKSCVHRYSVWNLAKGTLPWAVNNTGSHTIDVFNFHFLNNQLNEYFTTPVSL